MTAKKKQAVEKYDDDMNILDSGRPVSSEMVYGLGQAYGIEGFRKYLIFKVKLAIEAAASCSREEFDQKRGELLQAKSYLLAAKSAYSNYMKAEELRKK